MVQKHKRLVRILSIFPLLIGSTILFFFGDTLFKSSSSTALIDRWALYLAIALICVGFCMATHYKRADAVALIALTISLILAFHGEYFAPFFFLFFSIPLLLLSAYLIYLSKQTVKKIR
mgnify:CR=1 FL=1